MNKIYILLLFLASVSFQSFGQTGGIWGQVKSDQEPMAGVTYTHREANWEQLRMKTANLFWKK